MVLTEGSRREAEGGRQTKGLNRGCMSVSVVGCVAEGYLQQTSKSVKGDRPRVRCREWRRKG